VFNSSESSLEPGQLQTESSWQVYKKVMGNKPYIFICFTLSSFYFISTNVSFWVTDYLVEINGMDRSRAVIIVVLVCITGPIGGAITSAFVGKALGGASSMHSLPFCVGLNFINMFFAVPMCFVSNQWFLASLWLIFFIGGLSVPIMIGIMLAVVEPEYRSQASALS